MDKKKKEPKKIKKSVDKPKEIIKDLEQKLAEANNKHLRLYAEFDNFRKRTQTEKDELVKFATANFVTELLPIMDSFERAKQSFEKHTDAKEELQKGLALIHKQFDDVLAKQGVKKIETKGQKFDPQYHEAVMQQEQESVESGTILEEVQPGFLMNGKVIRPAMVIVAK